MDELHDCAGLADAIYQDHCHSMFKVAWVGFLRWLSWVKILLDMAC